MSSDINEMDVDEILHLLARLEEFKKYNRSLSFRPYDFQKEMFKAGKRYRSRFACLANRIGKTHSAAEEVSYHLTGRYPTMKTHGWDWEGIRYDYPILLWAIGITTDSTRSVLQKEILGTEMAKDLDMVGTGSVPRDCINFETIERDGNTIRLAHIAHYTDGVFDGFSTLSFRSTQQGLQSLMGAAVDFILLDEEDHYKSLEIYSQCLTRTSTKDKGRVLITATPEVGYTELIRKFTEEPELFIFHAGWDDAPHLTEETKKELLAGLPEFEIPMRTKGIPSKGSGAIFPIDDSAIRIPAQEPKEHWNVMCAVDFGKTRDPSVVMFGYKDDDGNYVIYDEYYLDKDRSVNAIAAVIRNSITPNIPVIVPHDGNSSIEGLGNETRANLLRELGCNVPMGTFCNPPFIRNKITNTAEKNIGKEGGLHWMNYGFKQGFIKVTENCVNFFKQKQSYFWTTKGGKTIPKDGNDDTIDCSRYLLLSIDRLGVPYGQCQKDWSDFNNGFTTPKSGISLF